MPVSELEKKPEKRIKKSRIMSNVVVDVLFNSGPVTRFVEKFAD
jgi:hypothetical protein